MKRFSGLLFTVLTLTLVSCGNDTAPKKVEKPVVEEGYVDPGTFDYDTICGIYSGQFGESQLNMVINYTSEGHAVGYNIVKGLQRNISGKVKLLPETVEMELFEPGDDKNDGVFKLSVNRNTLELSGTWIPNNKEIKSKTFTLERIVMPESEDDFTSANFVDYMGYVSDDGGNVLIFEGDGYCTYEYYPKVAEDAVFNQKEEINGTWTLKDQKVIIEWQPNPIFPSRMSVFNVVKDDEYDEYTLTGEGTVFTNYYF